MKTNAALKTAIILTALLFLIFSGCRRNEYDPRFKNIVLISLDSLRADHVGCYGYEFPTTPSIDRFAEDAVKFNNAYATAPWTLPSHGSMLTGLYPIVHKGDNIKSPMAAFPPTLAEVLGDFGYKSAAVVSAPFLLDRYKLNRGFDYYDQSIADAKNNKNGKHGKNTTRKGLKYIDKMKGAPFFLLLHYWDIHHPYNPQKEYIDIFDPDYKGNIDGFNIQDREDFVPGMNPGDLKRLLALYDGEIRYTDDSVGAFLHGLALRGLDKNTIVIITSDHGEEFLEHGGRAHLAQCWEETIRVPLLIKTPWINPVNSSFDSPVSLIDLFPTIPALLGLEYENPQLQGISLFDYISGSSPLPKRELFAETRLGRVSALRKEKKGAWTAMITSDLKKYHYFRHPKLGFRKLFDLGKDPGEKTDIFQEAQDSANLAKTLDDHRKLMIRTRAKMRRGAGESDKIKVDKDFEDRLKSLGYIE